MSMHRQQRRRLPSWMGWTGQAISFIALCVSALAAIVLIIVPLVTGSQTYSVLTSSMAPGYPPGTFLVVKPTDFDSLQTGDVITYQMESGRPEVITHRITSLTASQDGERMLITQGDHNDVADENPVLEVQVRGKLSYAVPYVGFLANALGNSDRGSVITVLAIGLIAWGAVTMIRGAIKDGREKRDQELIDTATQLDTVAVRKANRAAPVTLDRDHRNEGNESSTQENR